MSIQNPPSDSLSPFNVAKFTQYPTLTISYLDSLFLSKRNTTTSTSPLTIFNGLLEFNNSSTFNGTTETAGETTMTGNVIITGDFKSNSINTIFNNTIKTKDILPVFTNFSSLGGSSLSYNNLYLYNNIIHRGLSFRPNGRVATMTRTTFVSMAGAPITNEPFDISPLIGSLTLPADSINIGDTIHIKYTGIMTYSTATNNVVFNITNNGAVIIRFNFKTPVSAPTTNVQFTGDAYIFIKSITQTLGSMCITANSFTGAPPNLLYDSGYTSNTSSQVPFFFAFNAVSATIGMTYTNTFTDPSFSATITNFMLSVY